MERGREGMNERAREGARETEERGIQKAGVRELRACVRSSLTGLDSWYPDD